MVKYKLTKTCFSLHRHGQPGHRLHDPHVHLFYDEHHPAVGVQSHAGRVLESQQVMANYLHEKVIYRALEDPIKKSVEKS